MNPVGRLAPSPTGHLHLGNAWSFLLAWLDCRQAGGRLLLRFEDIDPERSSAAFMAEQMDDLHWLGLHWDGDVVVQSTRGAAYESALDRLRELGRLYPCYCTRKELRAGLTELQTLAGAPHVDDRGAPYAGTCRELSPEERATREAAGRRPCLRLDTRNLPPESFTDVVCGFQKMTIEESGGDFALRRSDGVYAYQLAVVVDDAHMKVTRVVRGNDILCSTPRQLALFRLLGHTPPAYAHIPLLTDADGERLAKRHASLSLRALRETGVAPERILGLLANKAGFLPAPKPVRAEELLPVSALNRLGREAIPLTPDDLHFLHSTLIPL